MKKKIYFLISVMLIMSLALTGCGGDGGEADNGGDSDGPVILGAVFPLTGPNALLGDESLRGAQIMVDELNASGGMWGREVVLNVADAPDATAAQTEAERLITKDGVEIVFGAYSSAIANVVSDVCARYEVPYFEFGAIGTDIMKKGYPYLWRTCAGAPGFGVGQAEYLTEICLPVLGIEVADAKVVLAYEDSLYGTSVAEAATEALLASGYNAANIKDIPYAATSVDLSSVILDARSFEPDAIFSVSYVNDQILLARQAEELNFSPAVWVGAGGGMSMMPTLEAVGNGMFGLTGIDFPQYEVDKDQITGVEEFVAKYEEAYGAFPRSGHSMTNYAGMQIMLDILKDAGSLDKDAIKEAAASIDVPMNTYTGGYGAKFDETGQNTNAPLVIGMWTTEKLVAVWPEEFAIEEPVIPIPSWSDKKAM